MKECKNMEDNKEKQDVDTDDVPDEALEELSDNEGGELGVG